MQIILDPKIKLLPPPKFRSLEEEEEEMMFALFDKHGGNLLALSKDPESLFKYRTQIRYYRDLYGWASKLTQIRSQRAQDIISSLEHAKIRAIQRAMELLETRTVEVLSFGSIVNIKKEPSFKEIQTAWEIIKTEMGEPTSISKTENNNNNREIKEVEIIIHKNESSTRAKQIENRQHNSIREESGGD